MTLVAILIGPMISSKFTNVQGGQILIQQHVQIGACSILMPSITIEEGVAVGAMSYVKKSLPAWQIYAGNPLKWIKARKKNLLKKL